MEQIGLSDFVPDEVEDPDPGCCGGSLMFQTFPPVMACAQAWLMTVPPNFRPLNVQSIVFRWKPLKKIDTRNMTYDEYSTYLKYIRYVRVADMIEHPDAAVSRSTIQLHCQLFVPEMTRPEGCCDAPEFESQDSVRARMNAWALSSGVPVVSMETVALRQRSGGEAREGYDTMITWNSTTSDSDGTRRKHERYIYLYKVYTSGNYPYSG